jgi:hypothetical protein
MSSESQRIDRFHAPKIILITNPKSPELFVRPLVDHIRHRPKSDRIGHGLFLIIELVPNLLEVLGEPVRPARQAFELANFIEGSSI